MTHQNILNVAKCELRFEMGNNNAENVLHARATGPITAASLNALEAVFAGWLTSDWKPISSSEWAAVEIVLTGENSLFDPRLSYSLSPVIQGDGIATALPANATVAVKADIGRRGKGITGRVFWIGLGSDATDGDQLLTATATAILAALNHLNSLVAGLVGWEGLCVPHLIVGGVRPENATSDIIVNFLLTDLTIDSQRDRLPGHKKHKRYPVA